MYLDYSDVKKNSEFQFKFNVEKQKIGENSWQSGGDGLGRVEVKYNVVYNPPTPTPTPTATKSKTPTKTPTKTQESVDFNAIASQMQNSTDKKDDYSDVTGTIVHVDLVNGLWNRFWIYWRKIVYINLIELKTMLVKQLYLVDFLTITSLIYLCGVLRYLLKTTE